MLGIPVGLRATHPRTGLRSLPAMRMPITLLALTSNLDSGKLHNLFGRALAFDRLLRNEKDLLGQARSSVVLAIRQSSSHESDRPSWG